MCTGSHGEHLVMRGLNWVQYPTRLKCLYISPDRVVPAATAGLRHGDVIVAADSKNLESHVTLQGIVSGHETGETIKLRVRRCSGEFEEISVVRP